MGVFSFCSFAQSVGGEPTIDGFTLIDPAIANPTPAQATPERRPLAIQSQANYLFTDPTTGTEYRGSSRSVLIRTLLSDIAPQNQNLVDAVESDSGALSAYNDTATDEEPK